MIKTFEYIFPLSREESFAILDECGSQMSQWVLVGSNVEAGEIEWKQNAWSFMGFSKIRVYLHETRTDNTLATIYVSRPMQIIDPFKMCDRVYKRFRDALDQAVDEMG